MNWLTIHDWTSQRKLSHIGRPPAASGDAANDAIANPESSPSGDPNATSTDQSIARSGSHWARIAFS